MNKPAKCCPHCDADVHFGAGEGDLSRCWLCRNPLPPGLAPEASLSGRSGEAPPAPKPAAAEGLTLERFLRKTAIVLAALIAVPIATVVALFAVCSVTAAGMIGVSFITDFFK